MMNPIKTPLEMLYDQAGIPQHMAGGGKAMTPQEMLAMLLVHGKPPAHFAAGGKAMSAVGKYGVPALLGAAAIPEAMDTYSSLKNKDYGQATKHGLNIADLIASGVSLPYWLISSMLGSGDVSSGTMSNQEEPDAMHNAIDPLTNYLFSLGK